MDRKESVKYLEQALEDLRPETALAQSIKTLLDINKELEKYENGELFSSKQIKLVEKGVKIGAEIAIDKEMENFVSKRKLKELLEIDEIGVIHCRIKQWLEK